MNVWEKKAVVSDQFQNRQKNVKCTHRKAILSVPLVLRDS